MSRIDPAGVYASQGVYEFASEVGFIKGGEIPSVLTRTGEGASLRKVFSVIMDVTTLICDFGNAFDVTRLNIADFAFLVLTCPLGC